jgi:hypothetical protein
MEYIIHATAGGPHRLGICNICFQEFDFSRDPGQVFPPTVAEVVYAANFLSTRYQCMDQIRSNKACGSGDKILGHGLENNRPVLLLEILYSGSSKSVRIEKQLLYEDYFFDLPAFARTLRTFLGDTFSTFATRETFLPSFSHTRGITSSANSSVSFWKVLPSVTP